MKSKLSLLLALALSSPLTYALDVSGRIGIESRLFFDDSEAQTSLFAEPELYWENKDRSSSFTLEVFARYDNLDDERSHADIREAIWLQVGNSWELRAGLGKVYWGVSESNHLVDIINQTDFVESADGEQKLGQAMLQFTSIQDWGVVDAFILPGFRERTFAGEDGRLKGPITIDTDAAQYEHKNQEKHIDFALRYSHSLSIFDLGLTWFKGTNRDPQLTQAATNILVPYYDQITQYGIDMQATQGDWLWKLETIQRQDSIDLYQALSAGFEYTLVGFAGTDVDMGLLAEYSYDSRDKNAATPLQNDLFLGTRFTFNDVQSSDLLIGVSQDIDNSSSYLAFIEGSRRLGNNWRATIDARLFNSDVIYDPIYFLRNEDYTSFTLEYFY